MSDDPVRIQVNVRTRVPKGKKLGKKAISEAIERWAYSGIESKWVEVRAVHWLNPERRNESLAIWKVALAADVDAREYSRLRIAGEEDTGDTIEAARRSLRLDSMPPSTFASLVYIKDEAQPAEPVKKPKRKRAKRGKKNAPEPKRKVRKVRSVKRKSKKK